MAFQQITGLDCWLLGHGSAREEARSVRGPSDILQPMTLYDERGYYLVGGQLPLATREGRQIPNDRRPQVRPEIMRAARDIVVGSHPTVRARSLSAVYDCMGMVFGSRRVWIDTDELELILDGDDYRRLSDGGEVTEGDVVVYRDEDVVTHVGIVARTRQNLAQAVTEITVLSQWGRHGEYFHGIDDVDSRLGTPAEFWTDRTRME